MSLHQLCLQLIGWEGWLVEATDLGGEKRRFVVGRTTDDTPIHLEINLNVNRKEFTSARDADRRGYRRVRPVWPITDLNPI